MTDKKITCKYKFQDEYHYNGKPYCTLFEKQCKDLDFICDKNCQVFEDYKQLQRKITECEELRKVILVIADKLSTVFCKLEVVEESIIKK